MLGKDPANAHSEIVEYGSLTTVADHKSAYSQYMHVTSTQPTGSM